MKANTAIGIVGASLCLLVAVVLEGGSPAGLVNLPALLIVVGGTAMACFASTSLEQIKLIPALYKRSFGGNELDSRTAVGEMVALAEKARRDGLLALEDDLGQVQDAYTRKGMQLVVDGADSDLVRAILESEIDGMSSRHRQNANLFATAGAFAPTLGILGTVLSLVHVLENLSNPSTLGHSIAGAFLATLYGVGSANLVFLPVANKLRELAAAELLYREMLLEAILAIQAGANPRLLAEKLETFVPPHERRGSRTAPDAAEQPPTEPVTERAA